MNRIELAERRIVKTKKRINTFKDNKNMVVGLGRVLARQEHFLKRLQDSGKKEPKKPAAPIGSVADMKAADAVKHIKAIENYDELETAQGQEEGREDGGRSTVLAAIASAEETFE